MKTKYILLFVFLLIIFFIHNSVLAETLTIEEQEKIYEKANVLLMDGEFEEAHSLFKSLGKYKDSRSLAAQSLQTFQTNQYKLAISLFEEKKFEEAQALFKKLDTFRESKNLLYKTNMAILRRDYEIGKDLYKKADYEGAYTLFIKLGNFANSETYAKEAKVHIDAAKQLDVEKKLYLQAESLLKKEKFLEARELYIASGDYADSYEKIKFINYQIAIENIQKRAQRFLQSGNYYEAELLFHFLTDSERAQDATKKYLEHLKNNSTNDLEKLAISAFQTNNAGKLLNSNKEELYSLAKKFQEKGDTLIARFLFDTLAGYLNSDILAKEIFELYEKDKQFYFARLFRETGAYKKANEIYVSLGDYRFANKYVTPDEKQFSIKQLRDDKTSEKSQLFVSTDGTKHVYQIYKGVPTWLEAKAFCELLGGHLATIQSEEENTFVHDFMIESGYTEAYFGLSDEGRKGNWEWITGEAFRFSNWAEGEPSRSPRERFGMFFTTLQAPRTWNDSHFYEHAEFDPGCSFICEWDFE